MSLESVAAEFRTRVNHDRHLREQKAWVAEFNRMVRVANWRLNVEKRMP